MNWIKNEKNSPFPFILAIRSVRIAALAALARGLGEAS